MVALLLDRFFKHGPEVAVPKQGPRLPPLEGATDQLLRSLDEGTIVRLDVPRPPAAEDSDGPRHFGSQGIHAGALQNPSKTNAIDRAGRPVDQLGANQLVRIGGMGLTTRKPDAKGPNGH